ncbi:MAG: InlB B-repeat-containing protein, partial [Treponema sp.]|nr:InlB B-repeat-containing protein [Treponema sp.]
MKKARLIAAAAILTMAFCFFACPQPPDSGSETPQEEYSLTFDANGGAFPDGTTVKTATDTEQRIIGADFPAEPVWEDHVFEGWFAGEAEEIEVTANTLLQPASGNFTAYARWEELPAGHVPVSFYYNDGSGRLFVRKTALKNGTLGNDFPAQNPMRVAYDFDGWYTGAEGGVEFTAASVVSDAMEVFARWKTDDSGLKLRYLFDTNGSTVIDWRGNYNGTLAGGARVADYSLDTGSGNGYVDMGAGPGTLLAQTENFTIAAYVNIDSAAALSGAGWFLWSFAAQPAVSNTAPCIWFRAQDTQFTISKTGYSNESWIRTGNAMEKGIWQHVMYRQEGTSGAIYLNGIPVASGALNFPTTELGTLSYNWIGRPCFDGDNYMANTKYQDFRIYDRALSGEQISALDISGTLKNLNAANEALIRQQIHAYAAEVAESLGDLDYLISDLALPAGDGKGMTVAWSSGDTGHLSHTGVVTRPGTGQTNAVLTLTGTFSKSGFDETESFTITIPALPNDANAVALDKAALAIGGYMDYFYHEIVLPASGPEGSAIT